jgi:hypothetical protein
MNSSNVSRIQWLTTDMNAGKLAAQAQGIADGSIPLSEPKVRDGLVYFSASQQRWVIQHIIGSWDITYSEAVTATHDVVQGQFVRIYIFGELKGMLTGQC